MSLKTDRLARQLVEALDRRGIPADAYDPGVDHASGVNVWLPVAAITEADPTANRYPQASIVVADHPVDQSYAWGHRYEHELPLETEPADVAAQVIESVAALAAVAR